MTHRLKGYATFCVLLLLGALGAPAADPPYEWEKITLTAEFAPRDGAGALSFGGKMWLLGGWNPSPAQRQFFPLICNNEVWSSTDGAKWTLVKDNTFKDRTFDPATDWEGRHTAGYAVYRDKMWIIGGDCNQHHYQNDVWNSVDGKTWTYVNNGKDVPWAPRVLHYTVVHDDKIWVIGGQTMPAFAKSDEVFYRDLWTTTDGVEWKKVIPEEPCWSPRGMIGGSAVMSGRIWILGGGTYDTPQTPARKYFNDVWSSADGVHWEQHTEAAPWHPRQYHDVAVWDNRLWVMEGYHQNGGNRNDIWYSSDGEQWQELPKTPWKPRHAASLFVHNDALWMVAGNNMEPDVWRLKRK
jgi:N-acetylneuraminic acid mutarotase